jgi:hypothetical protein
MLRDKLFNLEYFSKWIEFEQKEGIELRKDSVNSVARHEGRALRVSSLVTSAVQVVIMQYGRGDAVPDIRNSVLQLLELLELQKVTLANLRLEADVREMYERLDLGTLYESLTLLAFVTSLRFSEKEVAQALQLIGHPGQDALLDNFARALGDESRAIAPKCKFPNIYAPLVELIASPSRQRSDQLVAYVEGWYKRMRPIYWYENHKGGEGAYFGYWCFEAALIAMLFDIDDAALAGHPNYPIDLVRHFRATA